MKRCDWWTSNCHTQSEQSSDLSGLCKTDSFTITNNNHKMSEKNKEQTTPPPQAPPSSQLSGQNPKKKVVGEDPVWRPRITSVIDDSVLARRNTRIPTERVAEKMCAHRRLSVYDLGVTYLGPEEREAKSYVVDVASTKEQLLAQEDTDKNEQITVEDRGPKTITLGSMESSGVFRHSIRGTYQISNLLQELAILEDKDRRDILRLCKPCELEESQRGRFAVIQSERLVENPVDRLLRMIDMYFWPALVRRIDAETLVEIMEDEKDRTDGYDKHVLYCPENDPVACVYYSRMEGVDIVKLPKPPYSPDLIRRLEQRPGILTLALESAPDPSSSTWSLHGIPFLVPGGRFNELYGWDSYFIACGLLTCGKDKPEYVYLSRSILKNQIYEVDYYGKILNANRSYYAGRTQPPFLTQLTLRVVDKLRQVQPQDLVGHEIALPMMQESADDLLKQGITAAIKEYHQVWTSKPRILECGLSRYCDEARGLPPETEASHFDAVLKPFAEKLNMSIPEYAEAYNTGEIVEPFLDEYFMHDRAVRESGHDTTYRLEKVAAHLATVDLNSLLYRYEVDIAISIRDHFDDCLEVEGVKETSAEWFDRAEKRKTLMNQLMWDESTGLFRDYNVKTCSMQPYDSVTTFWPLWAGLCDEHQVERLLKDALPMFEMAGGLVCGTEASRGVISIDRPNRQWDYPCGWVPHQMLAWEAILPHSPVIARRLAYRWLYTITRAFVDHNGVVPEKFDVVSLSHKLPDLEYGNQGTDFKAVPKEGFGWTNASYVVGMEYLGQRERRALGAIMPPEHVFGL